MTPWIISAVLYALGALTAAMLAQEWGKLRTWRAVPVVALWPLAALYALLAAFFEGDHP